MNNKLTPVALAMGVFCLVSTASADNLSGGQSLMRDANCETWNAEPNRDCGNVLWSDNYTHFLILQGDGNLVTYNYPQKWPRWASETRGEQTERCTQQLDGNFVCYDNLNQALWASGTAGLPHGKASLSLQNDGKLLIYVWTR